MYQVVIDGEHLSTVAGIRTLRTISDLTLKQCEFIAAALKQQKQFVIARGVDKDYAESLSNSFSEASVAASIRACDCELAQICLPIPKKRKQWAALNRLV